MKNKKMTTMKEPYDDEIIQTFEKNKIDDPTPSINHLAQVQLDIAIREKNVERIDELLTKNPKILQNFYISDNRRFIINAPPLVYVAQNNTPEIGKLLIDAGANVNQSDDNGQTPLMAAIRTDPYETAQTTMFTNVLLDHPVEIDAQDEMGYTALHYAVALDKKGVVETLLAMGAKQLKSKGMITHTYEKDGITPSQLAGELKYADIEKLFVAGTEKVK